ncbi:arginine--tRNA ligase [Ignatzschineria rhizosphaerae]|uniref:Arginine--tRNA ligase n=1 Tax=Ignatzschineria rhizosphaerae TaxID=2923279 RepID=A0ABY3X264_9GAMM|nr:arginine--tRNA ligase [Ignatzschineria rhizosphaerae]UNM95980.1 arginine--tRNA ligase [Ignatzschineria rhizosphaerae]
MKQIPIRLLKNALEHVANTHQVEIDPNLVLKSVERTRDISHGDFASNIAMMTARNFKSNPRAVAEMLIEAIGEQPEIAKIEIAGPGFINFTFKPEIHHQELGKVLNDGPKYGHNNEGNGEKVQIEFVSANPTGPLHVGHGRGAAVGDSIARVLEANGYDLTREFYYNDAGAQIDNLAASVKSRIDGITPEDSAWPEDGYRGEYIIDIANSYLAKESITADDREITASGDKENIQDIRNFAVAYLRREQDLDLKAFDINFDVYFLESSLYQDGAVDKVVNRLIENGKTFEEDGALWLRTTDYGDDKDRVMRKKEGGYTYFVPDVAYHEKKWDRGFKFVINEQGADHHGTISRVRAGLQALDVGIPQGWPEYVLHQMVMVLRDGQEVKISKRAGSYVTLRDLIDEVGKDATRYFLAARNPDSQLQFDIDLALSQSSDNPVYYIQYAHARICSILAERERRGNAFDPTFAIKNLDKLTMVQEYKLMRTLSTFGEIVITAGNNRAPHLIANYLQDLAADVHSYYNAKDDAGNAVRILTEDEDQKGLQDAKLYLLMAAKQVLANGLDLLGLSAPTKM